MIMRYASANFLKRFGITDGSILFGYVIFRNRRRSGSVRVFIIIVSYFLLFILFSLRTGLAKGISEMTNLVMLR
ncbi:hypothetical protein H839_12739 [Parageobacillus genomosp. 1]|uniref:Uncharacterized protein n=1 Tax=Parageobacillus genomosp. 1 TaxID=1295642 RepID=A0ABC9VCS6_9BACL|nr:hypothetical protein H839_12739 [Parageobacillus genomosp. 1]